MTCFAGGIQRLERSGLGWFEGREALRVQVRLNLVLFVLL